MTMETSSQPTVQATPFDLVLREPFRIAYDTVTHSRNVLVTARRGDLVGFGEAGPVPTITSEDQNQAVAGLERLIQSPPLTLPDPDAGLAASLGYETAMCDLAARTARQPLCTHMTGAAPSDVASSITVPIVDGEALDRRIQRCLDLGFTIFKVKAGSGLEDDLVRIAAVRDAVGDAEIRIDPNQGWSRGDAMAALPRLVDLDVAVLEQPLARHDLEGHAAVTKEARDAGLPIMLDESVFSPGDARRAIEADACDRINIKLQKTGSLKAAIRLADVAQDAGVPCMIGCMIESRIAILAAAHTAAAHPNIKWADLDGHTFLRHDPVVGGPTTVGGVIRLTEAHGLGIDAVESPVAETDTAGHAPDASLHA